MLSSHIELPPQSLLSIVYAAYSSDDARETFNNLLKPYYISFQQLHTISTTLVWKQQPMRLISSTPHPMARLVQQIVDWSHATNYSPSKQKEHFIIVATCLVHLWYWKKRGEHYLLQNIERCFIPYETPNKRSPYLWANVNEYGGLDIQQRSQDMIPLVIFVDRTCSIGLMMTLEYNLFNNREDYVASITIDVDDDNVQLGEVLQEQTDNFMLLLSRGPSMIFINAYLVSPSLARFWVYPVLMHPLGNITSLHKQ